MGDPDLPIHVRCPEGEVIAFHAVDLTTPQVLDTHNLGHELIVDIPW